MHTTTDITPEKNGNKRRNLMTLGIAVVVIGSLWAYFSGGRYISTDNAYLKAEKILLAPDVSGTITAVSVTTNQVVHKDDELFQIDTSSYAIAAEKARADLATSVLQIGKLKALYQQKKADLDRARFEASFSERDLKRQAQLINEGSVSEANRDDAELRRDKARQSVLILQNEVAEMLAALNNQPDIQVTEHPQYKAAQAALHKAELDLQHTTVRAPADGIVGSAPNQGDYARAGMPQLNFVTQNKHWIEANFKETELTNVRPGQTVTITVDTYPGAHWRGKVLSISPATDSEFSLLPAQNASGNWVKVVQRIATRISVEDGPQDLPLRAGMSTDVEIDTGHYPHLNFGG
jgi:membrane fusion protein, multidrug efflux system